MRIVTRPDFDGIVCAVLLRRAEKISSPVFWTEPHEIQAGTADIRPGDILANLPYDARCSLWFDHHISNKPEKEVPGAFDIAPSAARVIYNFYLDCGKLLPEFDELVHHTDLIDSATLDQDQVRFPQNYPYILLSMTLKNENYADIDYWNHLVDLLSVHPITTVIADHAVQTRCHRVVQENAAYESILKAHTRMANGISITDFRPLEKVPNGNRFLSYCLFPEAMASIKIRYSGTDNENVQISVGANIFNRALKVNIGRMLSRFGGGGHKGAGGCTLDARNADDIIRKIIAILCANQEE